MKYFQPGENRRPEWFDPEKAPSLAAVERAANIPPLEMDKLWLAASNTNYFEAEFEIIHDSGGLLCVRFFFRELSGIKEGQGGAHATFDLSTGRLVTLDDLFRKGSVETLTRRVKAAVIRDFGISEESLRQERAPTEEEFRLNENWFLCPNGVGFSYGPGEIAPFGAGFIRPVVPWKELSGILNEGSLVERAMNPPTDHLFHPIRGL